ncbi:putative bifunctional diguanylate cyclase/phosphodiesterase [Limimaricola pyoseonensis]|uniref:Diguanylate cyclase (GGDEF) domain-containing protein n=1 Tax=Limimaricola pyoseonensis TaxID=521013 RepID=A0A1G7KX79_9RHOB|nr:bifunctional diguanylate cyclase/phosphodiesterase [Limimaricola pyoseonensis]SDF41805.1 diguanylate cyclase (GGDEF) domain-containing protein [Limimaricola pyoseonensis]
MPRRVQLGSRLAGGVAGLRRTATLAMVPLLLIMALVAGGGWAAWCIALALPFTIAAAVQRPILQRSRDTDRLTGLGGRQALVAALDAALARGTGRPRTTAAMVIEIDGFKLLEERYDHRAVEQILQATGERLRDCLRERDTAARLEGCCFGVGLSTARRLDLETAIQMASRLQRALSEPIALDGLRVHPSVSVGFALAARLEAPRGEDLVQAATLAMIEAQRAGPGAIRSYSESMQARITARNSLADEIAAALDRGEISAHFQPQISGSTGAVTGVEALARWHHPERGLIPPAEFIPALEQAGLMGRLGELMVQDGLNALRLWDASGLAVPRVGVNFSRHELADPQLVERIAWEIDRFGLEPGRLAVEVLETVVADRADDMVIRNLAGLARLGCCLDLDDFGTGHAAITSIRRFSIQRLKIDRSFITRIDADAEQQKMVSAILTMAERLGLATLAEGVETEGEREMLSRLGCDHLQGFGIARPMPRQDTADWIRARQSTAPIPIRPRQAL